LLIVDDEPLVRKMLVRLLASRGYAALEAENGSEALELVAEHGDRIWAVLSDVRMPQVNGIRLAEALAATHPEIPSRSCQRPSTRVRSNISRT
jgi:CheY-like chemotaxis protein